MRIDSKFVTSSSVFFLLCKAVCVIMYYWYFVFRSTGDFVSLPQDWICIFHVGKFLLQCLVFEVFDFLLNVIGENISEQFINEVFCFLIFSSNIVSYLGGVCEC